MKRILLSGLFLIGAIGLMFSQNIYYQQDFEAGIPEGWVSDGFTWGNTAEQSSAYWSYEGNETNFMAFNDDALGGDHVGGGRVVSEAIDLTAVTGDLWMELNAVFSNGDYQGADETFKVSYSIDGGTTWEEYLDYGAQSWTIIPYRVDFLAGETVMLAFDYDDGGGWNFAAGFDDVIFADVPVNAKRRDYTLTINGGTQFTQCAANVDYPLEGVVVNSGYENITSFDVNVMTDGVMTTYSFDGYDIPLNGAAAYAIEDKINTGESFAIHTVSISNVNGEADADEDVTDNTANLTFNPVDNLDPNKAVVVEEATGTWCTWCPRGTVYLDEMSKRFGDSFVGIAVHNADPMAIAEYDGAITGFSGFTGFPSVIYNRTNILDPGEIVAPSMADMTVAPMAAITVGAEETGPILKTSVQVDFLQDVMAANHRLSIVITEDGLVGEGAGWNQTSGAYSGGGNGPMGGFEYLPASVPSEVWPYDHVGRALIGGFAGVSNVVVGDYVAGDVVSNFFQDYVIPDTWNKDNLHIIGILTNANGRIMNASSVKYADAVAAGLSTSTVDEFLTRSLEVYPNPVDDRVTISLGLEDSKQVQVTLVNSLGQRISTKNYGSISGNNELVYDMNGLNSGFYYLNIQIEDQMISKRVTKQ